MMLRSWTASSFRQPEVGPGHDEDENAKLDAPVMALPVSRVLAAGREPRCQSVTDRKKARSRCALADDRARYALSSNWPSRPRDRHRLLRSHAERQRRRCRRGPRLARPGHQRFQWQPPHSGVRGAAWGKRSAHATICFSSVSRRRWPT